MRRLLLLLGLTLGTLTCFASCGDSTEEKIRAAALSEGCLLNTDCAPPLVCAFRRCHTECTNSRDCAEGQRCVASDRPYRVCQLEDERACTANAECPLRMICGVDGQCRDQCTSERDCIVGQLCTSGTCADENELVDGALPVDPSVSAMGSSRPCSYSSDCEAPLVCRGGACVIECREDRDCPYFASCDAGLCRLDGTIAGPGGQGGAGAGGGSSTGGGASVDCVFNSDCPVGNLCDGASCRCECRQDRDCLAGVHCDGCACSGSGGDADASAGGSSTGGSSTGGSSTGGSSTGGSSTGGSSTGGSSTGGSGGAGGSGGGPGAIELIDCGSRDTTGATVVAGSITADVTWSGLVHVTGNVLVSGGATVTISPGTRVIVDVDKRIEFGWSGGAATIVASGSAQAPISFCGATADAGFWTGLVVRPTVTSNSTFDNVLIADAGGASAGIVLEADVTVRDVQVRNSGADGFHAIDFRAGSARLTVEGALGATGELTGADAATRFPLGGSLVGNGSDVINLSFSAITSDATFPDPGVPYVQTVSLNVNGTSTVTYEAGVEIRFAVGTDLEFGWNSGGATVYADGTSASPVVFRGVTPVPSAWGGVSVRANVTSLSRLSYVQIRHAGDNRPALEIETPITVDNVTLEANQTGVDIAQDGLNADSTVLSVTGTGGVPMTVAPNALTTLPEGGSLTGNATDQVLVLAGQLNRQGTVPDLGIPYFLQGDVDVSGTAAIAIAPGTEFIANSDVDIEVGYASASVTFSAVGTAADPIVFRGLDAVNGYWDGILVRGTALSASRLEHVQISHAGKSGSGAIELSKEIVVTSCTLADSAGYGILHTVGFSTNYNVGNTFSGNTEGDVGTL